jgi:hypothetical protein
MGFRKGRRAGFRVARYDKAEAIANYLMFVVYICLPAFFGSNRGM